MGGVDWDVELEEMAQSLGLTPIAAGADLIPFFTSRSVPMIYEVLKLHLGIEAADRAAVKIIKEKPNPWAFMDLETLTRISEKEQMLIKVPEKVVIGKHSHAGYSEHVISFSDYNALPVHKVPLSKNWADEPEPLEMEKYRAQKKVAKEEHKRGLVPAVEKLESQIPVPDPLQGLYESRWKNIPKSNRKVLTKLLTPFLRQIFPRMADKDNKVVLKTRNPKLTKSKSRTEIIDMVCKFLSGPLTLPAFLFKEFVSEKTYVIEEGNVRLSEWMKEGKTATDYTSAERGVIPQIRSELLTLLKKYPNLQYIGQALHHPQAKAEEGRAGAGAAKEPEKRKSFKAQLSEAARGKRPAQSEEQQGEEENVT
jgi:hypothetical protein